MTDYAERRTMMVDTQIRPSDVTKFPNHRCHALRPARGLRAAQPARGGLYGREYLDLGGGRVMLEPRTLGQDAGCAGNSAAMSWCSISAPAWGIPPRSWRAWPKRSSRSRKIPKWPSEAQTVLADLGADNVILHEGAL